MKIKYKDTEIYNTIDRQSICVQYLYDDPDQKEDKREQNKFYFNYSIHQEKSSSETYDMVELHFKAGMVIASQRMKETMEELKIMFNIFKENGSGKIEDFMRFIASEERNEKLKQLGI
jgi:hypothetical protein